MGRKHILSSRTQKKHQVRRKASNYWQNQVISFLQRNLWYAGETRISIETSIESIKLNQSTEGLVALIS